ncbi:hypothetical protein ACF1DY_21695 [Streptomyces albus]|uniref:hypothetical protein n=1 Tax=Streptomyces albus TaxID=1888 RepID=UPI003401BBD5
MTSTAQPTRAGASAAPGALDTAVESAVRKARRAADLSYGRGCGLPTVNISDVLRAAQDPAGTMITRAQAAAALRTYLETRWPLDLRTDAYLHPDGRREAKPAAVPVP